MIFVKSMSKELIEQDMIVFNNIKTLGDMKMMFDFGFLCGRLEALKEQQERLLTNK